MNTAYLKRKDHIRHCPGEPFAEELTGALASFEKFAAKYRNPKPYRTESDLAWTVCLLKAGIIDRKNAAKVLKALLQLKKEHGGALGEADVVKQLGNDEDTGSIINLGRTQQEPMSRLFLREALLEVSDTLISLLETVLKIAAKNIDTIMPGHTHLSQAQPISFGHYLLSVFEALSRNLESLETTYKHVNMNSGGCGSCSGTVWPVDRYYMTKLLGFDSLLEPTYDCEASQDHSAGITFALSNIALLLSKSAMDINIWGMEEVNMFRTENNWAGVSSMMPQKCIQGSQVERTRIASSNVIGEMMKAVTMIKNEPHSDMLPMVQIPNIAVNTMAYAHAAMKTYNGVLKNIRPQKRKMLEYVREGYSCATEIVVHMVKELGYGGRRSHRICAVFVKTAREKGLKAYETTGEMLDEAARLVGEKAPGINTEKLRELLDPVNFINTHSNTGGTEKNEALRMINERKKLLVEIKRRQNNRKKAIEKGRKFLDQEIEKIVDK